MRYVSKEFLSPCAHETGSIVCTIETPLVKGLYCHTIKQGVSITASVKVSDCHEHAIIDFNAHNEKSFNKRIAKLDKFIDELVKFRHQMIELQKNQGKDFAFRKQQLIEEGDWREN